MASVRRPPDCVAAVADLRRRLRSARRGGRSIGLVPTMGFLHRGHQSLIQQARAGTDLVVVSIFVNPLQFAPTEDFDDYPRDLEHDLGLCAEAGADVVFVPESREIFPAPPQVTVTAGRLSQVLCGISRPTHFDGVATVVAKLFSLVGECTAYFGQKDYQQLLIIRRLAADLSMPVKVVGCPTVREPDGVAMSSRNAYLNPAERAQAPVLRRALDAGATAIAAGETDPTAVEAVMGEVISAADLATLDYAAARPADDIAAAGGPLSGEVRLLVAARFGRARLIDNIACTAATRTA